MPQPAAAAVIRSKSPGRTVSSLKQGTMTEIFFMLAFEDGL